MSINDYSCLIVRVDVILVLVRYIIILRLYATIMHLLRHGPTRTGFLTHVLDNCFRMRLRLLAHTCFKLHTAHQCPHVVINHQTRFTQTDMTTNKQLIVYSGVFVHFDLSIYRRTHVSSKEYRRWKVSAVRVVIRCCDISDSDASQVLSHRRQTRSLLCGQE